MTDYSKLWNSLGENAEVKISCENLAEVLVKDTTYDSFGEPSIMLLAYMPRDDRHIKCVEAFLDSCSANACVINYADEPRSRLMFF